MSIYVKLDAVLPRLMQQVKITNDTIRGDLYMPTDSVANADTLPEPFSGEISDLAKPKSRLVLPAVSFPASGTNYAWIGSYRLQWDSLIQRGDWAEHAIWIVPVTREGQLLAPFNATTDSLAGRWPRLNLFARRGWQSMLNVFVPHRSARPADCVIAVNAHPDYPPLVTPQPLLGGADEAAAAVLPKITLLAPLNLSAGAVGEIALQVRSNGDLMTAPCTIHLDAVAGYLPHRRVVVSNGEASFRFHALGLQPGEQTRIKAGWKYWPGAAEAEIAIV